MPPIYYNPCTDCKHKDECYYGTLTYCDVCSFVIYKNTYFVAKASAEKPRFSYSISIFAAARASDKALWCSSSMSK